MSENDTNGVEMILAAVAEAMADKTPVTDEALTDAAVCWQALDTEGLTSDTDAGAMLALWMRHQLNAPPWREHTTVADLMAAMGEEYHANHDYDDEIAPYLAHARQAGTPQGALVQAWAWAFGAGVALTRIGEYYRDAGDEATADELHRLEREHIAPAITALVRHAKATAKQARRLKREAAKRQS